MSDVTYGSLFSGVGGFDLGFDRAGMSCKWQVEKDPFCLKVLTKHWPNVQKYDDVKTVGSHNLEPVDVICGGFPCQDVSNAGKRIGIKGERSGLWSEFHRIICELRPRFVVVENVPGLLVRGMDKVLGDLAEIGYDAEWQVLSAKEVGAPHSRERVFIVAYPDSERRSRPQVFANPNLSLPEKSSGPWTTQPPILRVVDGVSDTMDRLRCLGNAVVPQCAEWIGRCLMSDGGERGIIRRR